MDEKQLNLRIELSIIWQVLYCKCEIPFDSFFELVCFVSIRFDWSPSVEWQWHCILLRCLAFCCQRTVQSCLRRRLAFLTRIIQMRLIFSSFAISFYFLKMAQFNKFLFLHFWNERKLICWLFGCHVRCRCYWIGHGYGWWTIIRTPSHRIASGKNCWRDFVPVKFNDNGKRP